MQSKNEEIIQLIDDLECGQAEKNKIKNALGLFEKFKKYSDIVEECNKLGILSPLVHTSSMGEAANVVVSQIKPSINTPLGPSFRLEPGGEIKHFIELTKNVQFPKCEIIPKWAKNPEDVYKNIIEIRGCQCCSLKNCEVSSGFTTIAIELDNSTYGFCVVCKAHQEKIAINKHVFLRIGTHIYY